MAQVYNSQLDAFSLYHKHINDKESAGALDSSALPALGHAVAGSTGAAISNVVTYPLDLIITRLQIQRQLRKNSSTAHEGEYKSYLDAAEKIYERDGIAGFYAGVLEDTTKTIADSFLFFLAYNFLRTSRLKSNGSKSLPVLDELSVGFAAGAFSKMLTTPISNVVTRLQTASMVAARDPARSPEKVTAASIASQIYEEKGIQGFWSGYSASLVLTLNPSLTFFFFETFKHLSLPRASREHPPAAATFFLAALSKALASSITYPFSLAKARAQASSKRVDDNDEQLAASIEKATDNKTAGTKRTRQLARSTVFSTIIEIAQKEGYSALYEGLAGEVVKGFLSHGMTMLVKEAVHKTIIKLYFALVRLLKRTPSTASVVQSTKDSASSVYDKTSTALSSATSSLPNSTQDAYDSAASALASTKDAALDTLGSTSSNAGHRLSSMREQAFSAAETAYHETQRLARSAFSGATDGAEEVSDYVADYLDDIADRIGLGNAGGDDD